MPRGNPQNMKPLNTRTIEERKEIARRAGIKSGETRRARKTLKEELLMLLSDGDVQAKMSTALIQEAIEGNKAGSVTKAFETIRDTIGEKPIDKIVIAEVDQAVIDEVEAMMKDDEN